MVEILLKTGPSIPNVNLTNGDKETALHCAAQYGHLEVSISSFASANIHYIEYSIRYTFSAVLTVGLSLVVSNTTPDNHLEMYYKCTLQNIRNKPDKRLVSK